MKWKAIIKHCLIKQKSYHAWWNATGRTEAFRAYYMYDKRAAVGFRGGLLIDNS